MAEIQNILLQFEIDQNIRALELLDIELLGSVRWFEHHERVQKLHQQAILELRELKGEAVKEIMVSYKKIPVLVYDIICISVWREKVLPLLLEMESHPSSTMVPYMVLFHEATAVEFLETVLFHQECCEALGEKSIELIAYAVVGINCLLAKDKNENPEKQNQEDMSAKEDLICKQKTIFFKICMKCITLLAYIIQHIHSLPLSASVQVFSTFDLPVLYSSLIEIAPWKRSIDGKSLKYINNEWQEILGDGQEKMIPLEAHAWLTLKSLVFEPYFQTHYHITDYRKNCLLRVQRFLTETFMDQMLPLIDLKRWLVRLAAANPPRTPPNPLLLEVIPEVRQTLLDRGNKGWKRLARKHAKIMYNTEQKHMKEINERLHEAYNMDAMELLCNPKDSECLACGEKCTKKCSRCKAPYCSRECQVKDWAVHKKSCKKLANCDQTKEK